VFGVRWLASAGRAGTGPPRGRLPLSAWRLPRASHDEAAKGERAIPWACAWGRATTREHPMTRVSVSVGVAAAIVLSLTHSLRGCANPPHRDDRGRHPDDQRSSKQWRRGISVSRPSGVRRAGRLGLHASQPDRRADAQARDRYCRAPCWYWRGRRRWPTSPHCSRPRPSPMPSAEPPGAAIGAWSPDDCGAIG